MTPSHHEQPMYRDRHDGTDMLRWLCTEPGCTAVFSDEMLTRITEAEWLHDHGMEHPNEITIIHGGTA